MNELSPSSDHVQQIRGRAGRDARIVFVSGNFNVVHTGHLRLLSFAAENGDFLVVAVNPDETPGVAVPAALRVEAVRAIGIVNYAFLLDEPLGAFIERLRPDIVVKGREHEDQRNIEAAAVAKYGGELLFSSGEMRFTAIGALEQDYRRAHVSTIEKPADYPFRHGFNSEDLRRALGNMAGVRVLVIGDLIVDRYIDCDPLGMSQEDPTIVVTPIEEKSFVGGAGIVAAHAQGLGAEAHFISVAGDDADRLFAQERLGGHGVGTQIFVDHTRPTTVKQRFRAGNKTLLRVNHLRQHPISADLIEDILGEVGARIGKTDLILFADFNYGCLPQPLVSAVSEQGKSRGIRMAADSQASSQLGDVSRFGDMMLLTPTEREARLALRDHDSGLVVVAEMLRKKAHAESVIVTLGVEGMLIHAPASGATTTDRLPAFNPAPNDVAGAGDALFVTTSLAMAGGANVWLASYLGALAAGCQVARLGNTPLASGEIARELDDHES
jgi:rfaE bifunctional protein kinase chain/domain